MGTESCAFPGAGKVVGGAAHLATSVAAVPAHLMEGAAQGARETVAMPVGAVTGTCRDMAAAASSVTAAVAGATGSAGHAAMEAAEGAGEGVRAGLAVWPVCVAAHWLTHLHFADSGTASAFDAWAVGEDGGMARCTQGWFNMACAPPGSCPCCLLLPSRACCMPWGRVWGLRRARCGTRHSTPWRVSRRERLLQPLLLLRQLELQQK